jgi:hypothetical protein
MTVSQLKAELHGSRERLFALVDGLREEQFRRIPEGAEWPIAAHLAHLLRTERVFTERAARAVHEDLPTIPSTRVSNDDDPALAQRLAVPQIVHGLLGVRRELESLLDLPDVLDRALVHERLGRMTVRDLARKMAHHEREHADAIAALREAIPPLPRPVTVPLRERS